jgi:hypothetical protein
VVSSPCQRKYTSPIPIHDAKHIANTTTFTDVVPKERDPKAARKMGTHERMRLPTPVLPGRLTVSKLRWNHRCSLWACSLTCLNKLGHSLSPFDLLIDLNFLILISTRTPEPQSKALSGSGSNSKSLQLRCHNSSSFESFLGLCIKILLQLSLPLLMPSNDIRGTIERCRSKWVRL